MIEEIETKMMKEVRTVLSQFGNKYIDDNDVLNRQRVIDDLDKYDKELMQALLSDRLIHDTYTEKVLDTEIFKLNEFISMFEYRDFWGNHFTKYSRKIGLASEGKFIDDDSDVVLDFPFKDAVLKAGMTKQDVAKGEDEEELFLNDTLAQSEINELYEPKILINAKRYDAEGKHAATSFRDNDNLIIKGNNLIALHSLKERYAGKIKLIFIDPPYNTGKDDFPYNDAFHRASWLTFMKNRLEIAQDLLRDDGLIFITIDNSRASTQKIQGSTMEPYLHVLLDEIFKPENYIGTLDWKKKKQPSYLSRIAAVLDHVLVFAKNQSLIHKLSISKTTDKTKRIDNGDNPISTRLVKAGIRYLGPESDTVIKAGSYMSKTMTVTYDRDVPIKNGRTLNDVNITARWRNTQEKITSYCDQDLLYINKYKTLRRYQTPEEEDKDKAITDLLLDWGQNQDATKEQKELFGKKVFDTAKPEKLLMNIIKSSTHENDMVLDFFMGSATTQAVAMKMHRHFIGIEQMDYINTLSVPRLQKVIKGEQGGVSGETNWQGGGSFVYAELMEKNQKYLDDIQAAKDMRELDTVYEQMKENADLDFRLDLQKYENDPETSELSLNDRKKVLMKMLDKNRLYYNEANIDDANVRKLVSDSDYQFNKSFYDQEY